MLIKAAAAETVDPFQHRGAANAAAQLVREQSIGQRVDGAKAHECDRHGDELR